MPTIFFSKKNVRFFFVKNQVKQRKNRKTGINLPPSHSIKIEKSVNKKVILCEKYLIF